MKSNLSDQSTSLTRKNRRKHIWYRVVSVMASVVVFCTTYALILPAITLTEDYYCGLEEHEHTEECYKEGPSKISICTALPHQHQEACYDGNEKLICGAADYFLHTHTDICYDSEGELVCELPEQELHVHTEECYLGDMIYSCGETEGVGHVHGENCYILEDTLICDMQEQDAHQHEETCFLLTDVLICTEEECDSHYHNAACYGLESVLSCMEQEREAHYHEDSCYGCTDVLACGMEEMDGHYHSESCYGTQTVLACGMDGMEGHVHEDTCYQSETYLMCGLDEYDGHTHDASCYIQESSLICGMEETDGHVHGDSCYTQQETLTCTLKETDGHTHGDSCYAQEEILDCTLIEGDGHTHAAECYAEEQVLQCTIPEGEVHRHDETCLLLSEPVLVCDKDELVLDAHDPDCQDENGLFTCGKLAVTEHVHTEECFQMEEQEEPELICELEEHVHELICTSDITADVETAEIWRTTLPSEETLTGIPAEDLLAVARTQLGYHESTRNFTVTEEGERKGYTRYGQWYGDMYGDWCAMYVSFCLHYAGIPAEVVPYEANCQQWLETLESLALYRDAQAYTAAAGDLVFFGGLETGAVHVGIVEESTEAQITVLEGNAADCVARNIYPLTADQSTILGYASMEAIHARGVELGLLEPLPEVEEETTQAVRLEAAFADLQVILEIPEGAVDRDPEQMQLLAQEPSESVQTAVAQQLEADAVYTALDLQLLLEDAPVALLAPVSVKIGPYSDAQGLSVYTVAEDPVLTAQEITVGEDGFVTIEVTELSPIVILMAAEKTEPEYIRLESAENGIRVSLTALKASFGEDPALWQLQLDALDEESLSNALTLIEEDQVMIPVNIRLINGEEPWQDLLGGDLTFAVEDEAAAAAEDLTLYRLHTGEAAELVPVTYETAEDGTWTVCAAEPGIYAFVYTKPYEGMVLQTDCGDLHITIQAAAEAFVTAPGALTLTAEEMDEAVLCQIKEKISAFKTVMGIDLQVMAGELEAAPEVPVDILITDTGTAFAESSDFVVYQYTGTTESGALNLTELAVNGDSAGLKLKTSQLSGLVITWEGPYEGIQLEADYGDIHIRLRAPLDVFPVTAENLTLMVTEPAESMKASIAENMDEDQAYFAVDIQILCDGQPIQPNGDVQVIFEMKDDPFPNAEEVEVYHVVEDTENQILDMQQVEGGYNDSGDVVMETNHFSTYVVTEGSVSRVATYAETPTNTWQEALTDRSGNVGVESEGYTDSPYTKTRQFNGANITALTSTGGTVYVGNSKLLNYGFYAERYWDGTKPVRITSTDPNNRATLTRTTYADIFLEDGKAPNAPIKFDNIHLETNFAGMNIYGRGNKIVIGENVTTESGELFRIYGGSDTNNSTTSCPTNVVVESGDWHLVCGGGHGDIPNGTTVTVRGDANITTLYGGGTERSTVGTPDGQNTDVNIHIEGGNIDYLYGGNRVEKEGCAVYEDINIEVTGGHVGILCAGNDYSHVDNPEEWEESFVQGNVTVTIKNGGSATQVIGDPYHTPYTRSVKGATILECYENEKFNMLDQWDVVRIIGDGTPNSTTVETLDTTGGKYIGRIEVNNGGRLYMDMNGYINILNEKDQILTPLNSGSTPYDLKHAWQGESTEERRNLSTLAIEGAAITPSGNYYFDQDEGKAGLRIKGNVEGYSTLEACGTPMYSTGDTYYYYVVADSSDTGGKAFREPEGAPYVVCYRYLEDGRIGWYLRERPVLTMTNSLVRVGTDGTLTPTDDGFYTGCPSNYVIMHVDMKGFAYEWSSTPGKNRVDFSWTIFDGYENATAIPGGISVQTMADIENNIYSTSNPNGIFANVEYNAMGSDEGSTEQTKRVSSFYVIIDTSKAVNPRYYDVSSSFHYTRGEDNYDDLRVGQTVDAARCTYDFDKEGDINEGLPSDGYANSIMTTYEYKDGVPPKGADDALLRVYLPEGVSANTLTVKELDEQFTFEKTGIAASLVSNSQVATYYSTEEESTYNHKFGVTLQQTGSSEIDLAGGATLNNLSGKETYHCAVYSHEKISFTDITPESNLGLQLQLQLNSLTKDGNAVGNGDPSAVNDGELRIQVYPVGTIFDTTTVTVKKIVTGDNPSTTAEFEFLLSYPKIDENGQNVTHEERFTLKHNEEKTVIVPLETEITISEINHDGYYVQIENEKGEKEHGDTVKITTPDKEHQTSDELKVTFHNSAGAELPESGGFGTQIHTFLGLLLTLGAIALFWMHRRERGTVC